jgi:hypothetical protein
MSPVGGTFTTAIQATHRFNVLRTTALRSGRLDPPPYGDEGKARAWRSGYEAALGDIARGKLTDGGSR